MAVPTIGVLALQGGVEEHRHILNLLGVESRKVRLPRDLDGIDGLILPGGESTTMSKLMVFNELEEPLRAALHNGLPAFGTCAGMILLASSILDTRDDAVALGALDIVVRRNAFGRQVDSFESDLNFAGIRTTSENSRPLHAAFIRAPWVESIGDVVEVLSTVSVPGVDRREAIVGVRQGNVMATSFHPESTVETRVHEYFLRECVRVA
ncbi:pyridoxal 5'-phosphate synthase glutaminase subunit PdxT [Corynebacterium sp. H78]|uniref:pyridoxal 5'-phosphate synthase glutaminase subunit PdxT n=1 Tax=Corynebacterium sp. H78 TaxID=3133417 RepID=UPI0030A67987